MKISAAELALLLISCSFSQTFSGPAGLDIPICCFTFRQHKLPWKLIQRHYITSSSCPQPAIVFVTREGRQVCANPKDTWVQRYVQILEQN
ncbi:CCL4 protein, partial [Thryothorus ludovicianus]|nr:CCL4 protein [Thryothorus ludovicianus]